MKSVEEEQLPRLEIACTQDGDAQRWVESLSPSRRICGSAIASTRADARSHVWSLPDDGSRLLADLPRIDC